MSRVASTDVYNNIERHISTLCKVIAAVIFFTAHSTYSCLADESSAYVAIANDKRAFSLSCIMFHYDYGPVPGSIDTDFASRLGVQWMARDKLHFFWLVTNHGFKGVYYKYAPTCKHSYIERFSPSSETEADDNLAAASYILSPIINKLDADLSNQCRMIIMDSSYDTAIRTSCTYYVRSRSR